MHRVKARSSFDHHGARVPGDEFTVSTKRDAEQLAKKGLVEIVGEGGEGAAEGDAATEGTAAAGKPAGKKSGRKS